MNSLTRSYLINGQYLVYAVANCLVIRSDARFPRTLRPRVSRARLAACHVALGPTLIGAPAVGSRALNE
jgi:hypothetical protein